MHGTEKYYTYPSVYKSIAATLAKAIERAVTSETKGAIALLAFELATIFKNDNPRFEKDLFVKHCTPEE